VLPRWQDEDDWDEDQLDDSEEFDDPADEDQDVTAPCPHCREPVYDDAEQCPHCGRYLSREDEPLPIRPWWFILGFFLALLVVYFWIFG
jgi:hypothetical protein